MTVRKHYDVSNRELLINAVELVSDSAVSADDFEAVIDEVRKRDLLDTFQVMVQDIFRKKGEPKECMNGCREPVVINLVCADCMPSETGFMETEEDYVDPKDDMSGRVPEHWLKQ